MATVAWSSGAQSALTLKSIAHAREVVRFQGVEPAEPSEVPLRVEELVQPLQVGADDDVVLRERLAETGSVDEGSDLGGELRFLQFPGAGEQEGGEARVLVSRRDRVAIAAANSPSSMSRWSSSSGPARCPARVRIPGASERGLCGGLLNDRGRDQEAEGRRPRLGDRAWPHRPTARASGSEASRSTASMNSTTTAGRVAAVPLS